MAAFNGLCVQRQHVIALYRDSTWFNFVLQLLEHLNPCESLPIMSRQVKTMIMQPQERVWVVQSQHTCCEADAHNAASGVYMNVVTKVVGSDVSDGDFYLHTRLDTAQHRSMLFSDRRTCACWQGRLGLSIH